MNTVRYLPSPAPPLGGWGVGAEGGGLQSDAILNFNSCKFVFSNSCKFVSFKFVRIRGPEQRTQNKEPRTKNPEQRTQNLEQRTQNKEPRT